MTKKELQARIAVLEAENAALTRELIVARGARPTIVVAPYQQPGPYNPYGWPQITCGDTTTTAGHITWSGP